MQSTKLIVLNGSFSPASHSGLNTTSAAAPTILQLASLLWGIQLGILFHTLDTLDYGPLLSLGMPILSTEAMISPGPVKSSKGLFLPKLSLANTDESPIIYHFIIRYNAMLVNCLKFPLYCSDTSHSCGTFLHYVLGMRAKLVNLWV